MNVIYIYKHIIFDNIVSDTHTYIIHFILPLCNCMQAFSTRIGIEVSRVSERLRALIWYGLHIVYCKSRNPTDELYIYSNNFSCLCTVPTRCTLSDSSPGNFQKFDGCFSQKKNKLLCSGFLVNEYSDSEREIRKLKKKKHLLDFLKRGEKTNAAVGSIMARKRSMTLSYALIIFYCVFFVNILFLHLVPSHPCV
jgi:hypothetical protein